MIQLKLKRVAFMPSYTIGHLYINDKYFCDTLEDANRDLNKDGKFDNGEQKVYSQTCIPFGQYKVKLMMSPKFKRVLPRLFDVPDFDGVLIHRGNTSKDTSGCILVGLNKQKGMVLDSAIYENKLVQLLKMNKNDENNTFIEIS